MVKKKRKHGGHYCKVCGCHKSNESFSGRGHALHICKECQSLPKDEQADMMRCNEVERAAFRFPMRRQDWELLEKYAKKYKDRESGKFAQEMLDMKRGVFVPEEDDEEADEWNNDIFQVAETPFSELEEDTRTAMEELLEDNINEYMIHKDYIPEGKDLQDIADWVLKETNDTFYLKAVPDDAYRRLVDDTVRKMVKEWKDDGLEIKTYAESLTIMETERLVIRKITRKDTGALLALMGKSEVMYAWEHGFDKKEVRQWVNRQFSRYRKDGYGYFALVLKDGGKLIGQAGLMKNNVKFIFEGEEEIGSPSLEAFCEEHKELLKSDVILVSDTSMLGAELPSLTTGLRGLAYWEIEVTGPNRDLHSGHFGGAVANPINVLCKIISKITDADGRITIPGFYDDVEEVPQAEREMIARIPFDEKKYKEAIGVKEVFGEKGYSTLERNSCRPSFDVCGIWGGYTGEGSKTVLPSKAYAKVSCRLVPHQDHHKISQMFADYILSIAPDTVQVKVTPMHGGQGYVCPISLPAYQAAEKGFEIAFGKKPLAVRRGGSIPIISTFEQVLGVKTVLMGFGLESDAIHSPNENFSLDIFRKGIEAVIEFHNAFR